MSIIEARLAVDDRGLNNTNQTTAQTKGPSAAHQNCDAPCLAGRWLITEGLLSAAASAGQRRRRCYTDPPQPASKSHAATGLCRSLGLAILRTLPITGTAGPRARLSPSHRHRYYRRRCCGKGTASFQGSTPADRLHPGHRTTCDCTEVGPRLASCLHESKTCSVLLTTACDTTAKAATSPAVSAKFAIHIP